MPAPLRTSEVLAAIERTLRGKPLELEERNPSCLPVAANPAFESFVERVSRFRLEPLGGRLLPLKRVLYWFVASAFDRQTKILEALVEALRWEQARVAQLEAQLSELRRRFAELEHRTPSRK